MQRSIPGNEGADQSGAHRRPDRIALLVGNAAYPGRRLSTPINDVVILKGVLEDLRFDVVVAKNTSKAELDTAIVEFGERIEQMTPAAISFFYFAGHAIQHEATNYLLPVDTDSIPNTRYLPSRAVKVDDVVEQLVGSHCRENVIVLDACRDNPLRHALRSRRDVTQGLAGLRAPPPGTLIAFSTAAGAVAEDGDGSNSPYLEALEDALLSAPSGSTISDIFHAVNKEVVRRSNRTQSPALYIQGTLETVLKPPEIVGQPSAGAGGQFVRVMVGTGGRRDQERAIIPGTGLHQWFKDAANGPEMVIVPAGTFLMGGRGDGGHQVTIAEPFAVSRFAVTVAQFSAFVEDSGYRPVDAIYTDEVSILESTMTGGRPRSRLRRDRSFRRPGFPQQADHPVVGVSWHDAQAYVEWLSRRTDKAYRLLTEAEWEYVARAGSTTMFWWGDDTARRQANYDFHNFQSWNAPKWRYRRGVLSWWCRQTLALRPTWGLGTGPVDICEPNPWGLFNVHGNVDEWVEDVWHRDYEGAPSDGTAWLGDGDYRVVRGGNWTADSVYSLTSAYRSFRTATAGYNDVGLRVARSLAGH